MPEPSTATDYPSAKSASRSERLGNGSIPRLLWQFSLPAIVGMMTQALYNLIDSIFVGRAIGELGIAAMFVAFPIMLILMAFGMLIGFGAGAIISIRLGEQKKTEAEDVLRNAAIMLAVVAMALSLLGFSILDSLLNIFGAKEQVLVYARQYMQIILAGAFFQIVGFGLNAAIRAEGNPPVAMMTLLIGVLLNVILAPFLIFDSGWLRPPGGPWSMPGLGWGMHGAAAATVIAQGVSAVWVIWYFVAGNSLLKLRLNTFRLDWPVCWRILSIGSPPFAMQLAACVLSALMNHQLHRYGGNMALAVMGIIYRFVFMILMPLFGLNQGAQPIIGYNYGAKKFDRVKRTLLTAIIWACCVTAFGFCIVMVFPAEVIRLFDPDNKGLVDLGTHAMRLSMLMLPIVGFQIVSASYFQAVGKPKIAMLLSLSRQVLLLIPAMLILPLFFGLNGVWAALPTADACSSLLTGICLFLELRHLQRRHDEG